MYVETMVSDFLFESSPDSSSCRTSNTLSQLYVNEKNLRGKL